MKVIAAPRKRRRGRRGWEAHSMPHNVYARHVRESRRPQQA